MSSISKDVTVSVIMITYGHQNYIKEAIEGVLMQECNFEIELIVSNDCSPDKTDFEINQILEKHPLANRIKYINHKKNIGANNNYISAFKQSNGKYIANCEGDDYWTDPFKLQKQVDFLEKNSKFSICWTKYFEINQKNDYIKFEKPIWENNIENKGDILINLDNLFRPYCTMTLTTMFRKSSFDFNLFSNIKNSKDNTVYCLCLTYGNGILLDFYSSVYRIHRNGIYSLTSDFNKYYSNYLNINEIILKIPKCNNMNLKQIRNGNLQNSIKFHYNQFSLNYLKLLFDGIKYLGFLDTLLLILKKFKVYVQRK